LDEALALPSEAAARLALRTQQILAHESGVTNVVDPLGGSYFLESLTDEVERQAQAIIDEIDRMGGVVAGIESGYFQREIAESAYRYQREVDEKERLIVGVNTLVEESSETPEVLAMDPRWEQLHLERLRRVRAERDAGEAAASLEALSQAALGTENLMSSILRCVRAYCTLGEITDSLRSVFGEYREAPWV
jgi:methylmalonyl-CoA mutase N-terminal domain/subunit